MSTMSFCVSRGTLTTGLPPRAEGLAGFDKAALARDAPVRNAVAIPGGFWGSWW